MAESPERLEIFLLARMPNVSRESLRRALARGACEVDGVMRHFGFRLGAGARVELHPATRLTEVPPEQIPLEILYEDDQLIAINKPSGMLVHPTSHERMGTVVNALRGMGYSGAHILHRLDRATSGVLLAAKALPRHSPLAGMFQLRQVEKKYLAIAAGLVDWTERVVDLPIGRDPERFPPWNVSPGGAEAQTFLRVLERGNGWAFLEAEPVTGRTNQIRIHCAAIGCPLVGDAVYGGVASTRLMLHALSLRFPLLDGGMREVVAARPVEFALFTGVR